MSMDNAPKLQRYRLHGDQIFSPGVRDLCTTQGFPVIHILLCLQSNKCGIIIVGETDFATNLVKCS